MRAVLLRSHQLAAGVPRHLPSSRWQAVHGRLIRVEPRRYFADDKPTVFPGSSSQTAKNVPEVPASPATPATPESTTTIPPANVPKTPPPPQKVQTAPPTSIPPNPASRASPISSGPPPPPPPPPPPRPKRRRPLRFLLWTIALLGLSYAGGVYYALINDNFHDFFTDYIPFAEEAVLYFEEREFRKRFPTKSTQSRLYPQTSGENKVNISGRSGVTARVTGEESKPETSKPVEKAKGDTGKSGQSSARNVEEDTKKAVGKAEEKTKQVANRAEEKVKGAANKTQDKSKDVANKVKEKTKDAVTVAKDNATEKKPEPTLAKKEGPATATPAAPSSTAISLLDPIKIDNAEDPIVQTVTKLLNDVIAVVNADGAASKYSSTIAKAKDDVGKLAEEIASYRATESKAAEDKIRQSEQELRQGAEELIRRLDGQAREQELQWREEYEAERERLSKTYQDKLKAEVEAAQKIAEQKLRNELLEQDIKLKDDFANQVNERVETERSGRLSKLNELESSIEDLQSLTAKWGDVIDSNLKTQHLVVAVETVRSLIESTEKPTPFVHELAALKEIANDDAIVNAAIASINPSAYQRGIATPAQLVDRFRRVASEVRKAALLPEDAGIASHVASFVLSKVLFKKNGLPIGDDVESVLTRTELLLEEGNIDEAAREMNTLTGWAKVLSKDWLAEARSVLEVKQAMDVIATEARLQSLLVE